MYTFKIVLSYGKKRCYQIIFDFIYIFWTTVARNMVVARNYSVIANNIFKKQHCILTGSKIMSSSNTIRFPSFLLMKILWFILLICISDLQRDVLNVFEIFKGNQEIRDCLQIPLPIFSEIPIQHSSIDVSHVF